MVNGSMAGLRQTPELRHSLSAPWVRQDTCGLQNYFNINVNRINPRIFLVAELGPFS
jgi:hypothetical protein